MPLNCPVRVENTSHQHLQGKPSQKSLQKLPQPQPLGLWMSPLAVSRERQHLGPQERRLVSSPLQAAAREISCSPSSLLAPFLHKASLVKSSTGPQAALTSAADPEAHLTQQTLNNSFSNGSRLKRLQILSVLPKKYLFAWQSRKCDLNRERRKTNPCRHGYSNNPVLYTWRTQCQTVLESN